MTRTFDHDSRGTLRPVTVGGTAVTYTVDGLGRRIAREENGTTTAQWLYRDALRIAAELDGQGALRWRFIYATGRHVPDAAIDASGTLYRIVADQVGSVRLVVRASDGAIMQRMRHDAWGRVEEDFVEAGFARVPFALKQNSAGGLVDQVTGLVHFGAREYDPAVGRWVEKDPIRFGGGTTGLYEYCYDAPIGLVDPSGAKPGDGFASPVWAALDAARHFEHLERAANTDNEWGGFVYLDTDGLYRSSEGVRGQAVSGGKVGEQEVKPLTGLGKKCPPGRLAGVWHTHGTSRLSGFERPSVEDVQNDKAYDTKNGRAIKAGTGLPYFDLTIGSDGSLWLTVPSLAGPGREWGTYRYSGGTWH